MSDLKVRPPKENGEERSPAARWPGSSPPLRNGEKQIPHTARDNVEVRGASGFPSRIGASGMTGPEWRLLQVGKDGYVEF
jgi:hypothetical protein